MSLAIGVKLFTTFSQHTYFNSSEGELWFNVCPSGRIETVVVFKVFYSID